MTLNEYQAKAQAFAIYPNKGKSFTYPVLGLAGEAGEVAEKFKKIIRDKNSDFHRYSFPIILELGDVLWYIADIAKELGYNLDEVAQLNLDKLQSRTDRNTLSGSGDNR